MVSMKDIAKACGVSVATVSKALNNYTDIGPKTRDKVRKTAEALGYFPNSSARALKTNRTWNLGVLLEDEANSGLTHPFFAEILQSFKVTAESRGFDLTFTSSSISARKMTYLEHCRYRGVDGVVIACINFYDPAVQELVVSDLPVVTIDHVFDNCISVSSDNVSGMYELTDYVCSLGHRKIAFIHGSDSSVSRSRLGGFYRALAEHGVDIPEEYILESPYLDLRSAGEATEKLLALPNRPTCILYPDDLSCIGGMNVLRAHGLKVGSDISIAGYDGNRLAPLLDPPLTTIRQDTEAIGRLAAEKLIQSIEEPKTTIMEQLTVKGSLIKGASVASIL